MVCKRGYELIMFNEFLRMAILPIIMIIIAILYYKLPKFKKTKSKFIKIFRKTLLIAGIVLLILMVCWFLFGISGTIC
jgi:ABC-type Fe3+ transport system permease subunit